MLPLPGADIPTMRKHTCNGSIRDGIKICYFFILKTSFMHYKVHSEYYESVNSDSHLWWICENLIQKHLQTALVYRPVQTFVNLSSFLTPLQILHQLLNNQGMFARSWEKRTSYILFEKLIKYLIVCKPDTHHTV